MKYPKEYLDEIKNRLKVSTVVSKTLSLKKRGKEYVGLSPFKNEKTPSFTVNDVLKQTSPVASPWYPIPIPLNTFLFSRTKTPVLIWDFIFELVFFAFFFNYNSWVKG